MIPRPSQALTELPVDSISREAAQMTIDMPTGGITTRAMLKADRKVPAAMSHRVTEGSHRQMKVLFILSGLRRSPSACAPGKAETCRNKSSGFTSWLSRAIRTKSSRPCLFGGSESGKPPGVQGNYAARRGLCSCVQ